MDINFFRWAFGLCTAKVAIMAILIYRIENYVPLSVRRIFIYGKSVERRDCAIVMELPKSWFKHFYIFGAPRATLSLLAAMDIYFVTKKLPAFINGLLNLLLGVSRQPLVGPEQTLLALLLFTFHLWKRLYESTCISVYSDAKINVIHYILGFWHYFAVSTCIVGEARGFIKHSQVDFHWGNLRATDYAAAIIFISITLLQLHCNLILARLRKDKKGNVVTKAHKIPHGGLFNYVTGALQFTEIVLYLMLSVILWRASTYHYITIWVLVNQTVTAIEAHLWYKKTFKQYPEDRKVIVPFVI